MGSEMCIRDSPKNKTKIPMNLKEDSDKKEFKNPHCDVIFSLSIPFSFLFFTLPSVSLYPFLSLAMTQLVEIYLILVLTS